MDRPKFWRRGKLVVGTIGSYPLGELVEDLPRFRGPRRGEDTATYLRKAVAKPMRAAVLASGAPKDDIAEFAALLVYGGVAAALLAEGGVMRSVRGYVALGAGGPAAAASLATTRRLGSLGPRERVELALAVAAEGCDQVAPPLDVAWVPK